MDPIRMLLELLEEQLPKADAAFEAQVREIFSKFELVPKREYEAHLEILRGLEAEVESLEARLEALETDHP